MANKIFGTAIEVDEITLHSAVSSAGGTTTSTGYDVRKYRNKTILFKATGISSGVGTFTVEVSHDGSGSGADWHLYDRIVSSAGSDAPVSKLTLSANGQSVVNIPDYIPYIRVKLSSITDGAYSSVLVVST